MTAFYHPAYAAVLGYFRSLVDPQPGSETERLMEHYASAFANCPKLPDPNIGAFVFQQGTLSNAVVVIVRGRAQIQIQNADGEVVFRSNIGDGEVVGDVGVIASRPRIASVRSLNRMSYLTVPDSLFLEAMHALGILYDGYFKELFQRRLRFQAAAELSQDVSTLVLNRIAKNSRMVTVKAGQRLYTKGRKDGRLLIAPRTVELTVGRSKERLEGPVVVGEAEYFLERTNGVPARLHTATALDTMEVLELDPHQVRTVPVIVDNLRQVIRRRRETIYRNLAQVDPTAT